MIVGAEAVRRLEQESPDDEEERLILLLAARHALKRSARLDRREKRRAVLRAFWRRWVPGRGTTDQ